ncbi:hypothetical protein [Nonomuraea typhae]|uniref:Orc1-like AAA ATPase domain-containing protein n=1 Tax=Nonomuraea typhae TaxID=2603600 RepID=A0ABW7Z617_9ACTN
MAEVGALCAAKGPAVVVAAGVGGVGKSALVSCLARDLAPGYPDGRLFTSVSEGGGPLGSGAVLARFLRALGVPVGEIPDDLASLAALYRTKLTSRKPLLGLEGVATSCRRSSARRAEIRKALSAYLGR